MSHTSENNDGIEEKQMQQALKSTNEKESEIDTTQSSHTRQEKSSKKRSLLLIIIVLVCAVAILAALGLIFGILNFTKDQNVNEEIQQSRFPTLESRMPSSCLTSSVDGYQRLPNNKEMLCDGGWTVFQRRFDGSVDFDRTWVEYKYGFGNMQGEFWLGLDAIHKMTSGFGQDCKLKIKMKGFDQTSGYAQYNSFLVDEESNNYRLHVSGFNGTAGDSLRIPNGFQFTTKDRDNDGWSSFNCALYYGADGGWWYSDGCGYSRLNAKWGRSQGYARNMIWFDWKGWDYAIKESTMMIRCD